MSGTARPMKSLSDLAATPSRKAHRATQSRRHASLESLHRLEAACDAPARGRAEPWLDRVRMALAEFRRTLAEEEQAVCGSSGLFENIRSDEPRLAAETLRIASQYRELEDSIKQLEQYVAPTEGPESLDFNQWRQQIADLTARYRKLRAQEADLIFDAYSTDIGAGD